MPAYNEINCKYYTVITELLNKSFEKELTLKDLRDIINDLGFYETNSLLIPPLISQNNDGYNLMINSKDKFTSILKNKPLKFITNLELSWIKSLLHDSKINLFLDEDDYFYIKKALSNIKPLYTPENIDYIRRKHEKIEYTNENFINIFKKLTNSLRLNKKIQIFLNNGKNKFMVIHKIEYSIEEDCFSLIGIKLENNKMISLERIALTQINKLKELNETYFRKNINEFVKQSKCKEPISFELHNIRSGFERVFMSIASFERITEFDDKKNICYVKLYYYKIDEDTIFDLLISFGPIIKILSPSNIVEEFKSRINNQFKLFENLS
jgi:hypothetical protein